MADIRNQFVKDTFDYVLQSDLLTGIVYRIGGSIPINPIFLSGLTVSGSNFTYGLSAQTGYILTSLDQNGVARWSSFSSITNSLEVNTGGTYVIKYVFGQDNNGNIFWQPYSSVTSPYITGGTYNPNTGYLFLDDQLGGSVEITGFTENELRYYVQNTTPIAILKSGDRWFDTDTGIELVWVDDGDSSQWVQPYNTPGPANTLSKYITTGITSSQTLTWDKNYWGISASTNVDLILPSTAGKDGYYLIIKDESGKCGSYRIRVTPTSGLIDGNNYIDMNINFMSLTFMVRGSNWYLI